MMVGSGSPTSFVPRTDHGSALYWNFSITSFGIAWLFAGCPILALLFYARAGLGVLFSKNKSIPFEYYND
jgi:hypothetical protein